MQHRNVLIKLGEEVSLALDMRQWLRSLFWLRNLQLCLVIRLLVVQSPKYNTHEAIIGLALTIVRKIDTKILTRLACCFSPTRRKVEPV